MKKQLLTKVLSFLYPITTKTYQSAYSGLVEITWFSGQKMVDTKNANYSYGSLQKILLYGLKQVNLTNVSSILLLGMGGGSVIQTLYKNFNYQGNITAVELDPTMVTIANTEFNIQPTEKLHIVTTDAFKFLEENTTTYNLVIIDLFIDTQVPENVYSSAFFNNIHQALTPNGQFIFNAALNHETVATKLTKPLAKFKTNVFNKVQQTNTVIIGTKI